MKDDTISRQAAIDAIKELLDSMLETDTIGFYEIENVLFEVPSAQPEHIHCKDCRWFEPDRHQCGRQVCAVFYEDDYCSFAERCTDETD